MYREAKKLQLIEEILKIEDEEVLAKVERAISDNFTNTTPRKSFKSLAGVLSEEEVNRLEKIIEEGCEMIHPDDWK